MTKPATTIKFFEVYVLLTGATLLLAPNILLSLFGLAEAREVWIRVLGVVVIALGYYYWCAAAADEQGFFKATIPGRGFVLLAFIALVATGLAAPPLILFGVIDAAGALWTWMALRRAALL